MGSLVQDTFCLLPVISAVVSIYLITSTTVPQIPVLVLRLEFGARFAPSVHDDISLQNWYSLPLFPLTEEGGYFCFRILANHLASIFFLPLSGNCFGLLYVQYIPSLSIRSQSANICWLSLWSTFFTFFDRPAEVDLHSSFNGYSLAAC